MFRTKALLIIGGSGQFGKEITAKFRSGLFRKWKVFNIDLVENKDAQHNFIIDPSQPIRAETIKELNKQMKAFDEEFEAIINVAGKYYPPNNQKVLKKFYEKDFESKSDNPLNVSSIECFDQYEEI